MMQPVIFLYVRTYATECIEQTKPDSPKNKIEKKNTLVEESSALICTLPLGVNWSLLKQVHTRRVNTCNASKCHCPVKIMCYYFTYAACPGRQRSRTEYLLLISTLLCTCLAIYSPISQCMTRVICYQVPAEFEWWSLFVLQGPQQMQGNMPIDSKANLRYAALVVDWKSVWITFFNCFMCI